MSEHMKTVQTDTLIAGENVQPVGTETEVEAVADTNSEDKVTNTNSGPKVELRDGKTFVDGTRVYSRDETNIIASRARKEVEQSLLNDLEVESFDKVKSVVSQLRDTESEGLDVQSLRDAVKKREQTVEELRAELDAVKTDYALRNHLSTLRDNMPQAWSADQKQAVVDLMKARDMLHIQDGNFHIRNGEDFITTDGETPDYAGAVKLVGTNLGLPFAKKGVENYDAERRPTESSDAKKGLDEGRVKADPVYRNAYIKLRDGNRSLARNQITDAMVKQQMKKMGVA